jgi:hypothetical protein
MILKCIVNSPPDKDTATYSSEEVLEPGWIDITRFRLDTISNHLLKHPPQGEVGLFSLSLFAWGGGGRSHDKLLIRKDGTRSHSGNTSDNEIEQISKVRIIAFKLGKIHSLTLQCMGAITQELNFPILEPVVAIARTNIHRGMKGGFIQITIEAPAGIRAILVGRVKVMEVFTSRTEVKEHARRAFY